MKLMKRFGSTVMKAYFILKNNFLYRGYNIHNISKTTLPQLALLNTDFPTPIITSNKRFTHDDIIQDDNESVNNIDDEYAELYREPQSVKDILYADSKDTLIKEINECASLQDIHAFITKYEHTLDTTHITQLVLVLWDLQKMFYHISLTNSTSYINISEFGKLNEDYMKILKDDAIYSRLQKLLKHKENEFNVEQLSYILLYLNKMGINLKGELISMLILQFKKKFIENSPLSSLARFMTAIYIKRDISFIYNIQAFIPLIVDSIEKCDTAEDLDVTTHCLNNINALITKGIMVKYVRRISKLLNINKIGPRDYKVIVNALMLLSLPQWRDKNAALIVRCILLMKDHLHLLNVNELLVVHEIFCKIQEPGHMLSEIQRCASKYLLQLEEEMSPQLDTRLKLFSCITYFAPPSQRPHFKKIVHQYIDYKLDGASLLQLHKILLFTKMSDKSVCQKFWEKLTNCLSDSAFVDLYVFRICQNYIDFNEDLPEHRCMDFENRMLAILEYDMKHKLLGVIPSYFPTAASFILVFGNNRQTLDTVIAKIKEFANYFNAIDCFHLSCALHNALNQNLLTNIDIMNIKHSLDKCTYKILQSNCDTAAINLLLKSYIYRNSKDDTLFHRLVNSYKNDKTLYSALLKNVVYNLFVTNTLVPDVMNWLIDYVVQQKNDILGYNVERILHLCYSLGFLPDKHEQFFQTAIDVILRDQQRMSGLSYLQSCLTLCFFNTLPQSFVKQIFNVEFLEKIDVELANCYFEDVYPARVRYLMMQLNRAVCLDYPEANIPWFHQKYIEKRHSGVESVRDHTLLESIKDCLVKLTNDEDSIKGSQTSPYGYHINFILHLDKNEEFVTVNKLAKRIAILVMKPNFYSRVHKQLKGFYQMKIRHLEILGYKVALIDSSLWRELSSVEEKMNYLINTVKSDEIYTNLIRTLRKANK